MNDDEQRQMLEESFMNLYHSMDKKYDQQLVDGLITSLLHYQNAYRPDAIDVTTLEGKICSTLSYYHPVPAPEDIERNALVINNGEKIGAGEQGAVYKFISSFDPSTFMITKVTYQMNPGMIRELFINFVIINDYLLHHPTCNNLVSTYGFYMVNQIVTGEYMNEQHEICISNRKECTPSICVIQEYVTSKSSSVVKTLSKDTGVVQKWCAQILFSLLILNEGPFHLTHNDIHLGNLLVDQENNIRIIDWGAASFNYQGVPYGYYADDYRQDGDPVMEYGALNDVFSLLTNCFETEWTKNIVEKIYYTTFFSSESVPLTKTDFINQYGVSMVIHAVDRHVRQCEKTLLSHIHNARKIVTMTFRTLINQMIHIDTMDGYFTKTMIGLGFVPTPIAISNPSLQHIRPISFLTIFPEKIQSDPALEYVFQNTLTLDQLKTNMMNCPYDDIVQLYYMPVDKYLEYNCIGLCKKHNQRISFYKLYYHSDVSFYTDKDTPNEHYTLTEILESITFTYIAIQPIPFILEWTSPLLYRFFKRNEELQKRVGIYPHLETMLDIGVHGIKRKTNSIKRKTNSIKIKTNSIKRKANSIKWKNKKML